MLEDLRLAARALRHARGFTAAAVLTLGLGIGANTIVYGVVDALLLRPLPFGDRGQRLVTLHSTHPTQATQWDDSLLSYADLLDVREAARTFETVEGVIERNFSMSAEANAERVAGASITPGLFAMLGASPQTGRPFTDADAAPPGQESVVIISHALWQRLYGGDRRIVGRGVLVNGRQLTVIGVMPPRFGFPEHQDVWLPLRLPRDANRAGRSVLAIGSLKPGVTLDQARGELASIAARLATRYPQTNRQWGIFAIPMRELFVGTATRRALGALLVAVALVLLVASANVASLLVARGVGRQRELAMRAALGAGRGRLVRLLVMESLVLALAGAGLGLLLATWGLEAFVASNPEPPPYWVRVGIDARLMLFAGAIAVLTALVCGLLPAFKVTRLNVGDGFLQGGRSAGATPSQRRFQATLVVGQIAVSLALLIGATLLARSAAELRNADAGFSTEHLLSLRFYIAGDAYDDVVARARTVGRVVDQLRAIPGVAGAAATGAIPADDGGDAVEILPDGAAADEAVGAQVVPFTPELFNTLGLRLLEGRTLVRAEAENPIADAVVVNRRLAARLWPGETAVGRTLRTGGPQPVTLRVAGVAPDVVYEELGEESSQSQLTLYVPYARLGWRTMSLLVRVEGDPAAMVAAARAAVRRVDPAFATYDVLTMDQRRAFTQWGERFVGRTFGAFAVAALLLACVGSYGLTAYSAAQRTREIGLRMAIGATRRDVVKLLLGRGVRLAAAGLVMGVPLAVIAARGVEGLLFNVSPWEPRLWVLVFVTLFVPVILANILPARRASRRDPAAALRHE